MKILKVSYLTVLRQLINFKILSLFIYFRIKLPYIFKCWIIKMRNDIRFHCLQILYKTIYSGFNLVCQLSVLSNDDAQVYWHVGDRNNSTYTLKPEVNSIHILTGYEGNSTFIVPKVPTIFRGNVEENSWYRGDN